MINYERYRQLMDEARETDSLAAKALIDKKLAEEERQAKHDQLQKKSGELRKQAMSFARTQAVGEIRSQTQNDTPTRAR